MTTAITPEIIRQHNLSPDEYQMILKHLGRKPNLVELGIFSVMWSEHCSYKSSRVHLKNFPTKAPWVLQGPGENAGIVDIGDNEALVFKMESHNHPSFIEPYQGAATGVGGILRDIFTMGARPIALLNSLHFGEVNHPKTPFLVSGVVSGIAGYGNCMGIPTVGGQVNFHASYNGNILVNAMTVGLVDHDKIFKGVAAGVGNPVIYVGSKTGRDGIHGATMASDSFDESAEQKRPTVQVGDPFTEKRLLEACLELMQQNAIIGIQDMGAAGLTSSSFEMAGRGGTGLDLNLDKIPLREEGMTPYEMMLSESQERMLMTVKKGCEDIVSQIFSKWDLDAHVVGVVTNTGCVRGFFKGEKVFDLPVEPIADGAPKYKRPYRLAGPSALFNLETHPINQDFNKSLCDLLKSPNLCSKKWVYRQYDHHVMTGTLVEPGSDAAVVRIRHSQKAVAMAVDVNSRYCFLDPYLGAAHAVAECGRNLVCSGAKPLAITDCLNFGNPENPEVMAQFERAVSGISRACTVLSMPVVSGNVSFYNETNGASIFPTPGIGAVGLIPKGGRVLKQFFQQEGDAILLLGSSKISLSGSEYLAVLYGKEVGPPPPLDLDYEKKLWEVLLKFIQDEKGLISSAHDLSDGGLAIALAECCFGKEELGAKITLKDNARMDEFLFGEGASRIIVSCKPQFLDEVLEGLKEKGIDVLILGSVIKEKLVIGTEKETLIDHHIQDLKNYYNNGFEDIVFKKEIN